MRHIVPVLRIRRDQITALATAHQANACQMLARELVADGESPERAQAIVAHAVKESAALQMEEVEEQRRLLALYRLPEWPNLEGRWALPIFIVLTNLHQSADARLTFLERELLPRYLRDRDGGTS